MVDMQRHARHLVLPQVGLEGQKKLAEAKGIQNELDDVVTDSIGATQASKEYHE